MMNFIPKVLFMLIKRIGNIFFLIISLIMLTFPIISPFQSWIFVSLLGITITVNISIEFWLDSKRKVNDILINDQMTIKAENSFPLKSNCKWKDLQIGDIIYLRKEDICPADIIILDTSEISGKEAISYIDTAALDGVINYSKKKASFLSQILNRLPAKNNFREYRKLISGKIEYEGPNPSPSDFLGFLRLKKDPKVEQLTIENFIPRGATLKYSEWIFGLVVFTGNDTKIMLNSNYGRHKVSLMEMTTNTYFVFYLVIVFVISIISIIIMIARVKELTYLKSYDATADSAVHFLTHLILYCPLLPLVLFSNLDLVTLLQKFFIERKVQDHTSHYLNILDPFPFTNIAQIQYIFLDKTGTITKTNYKVSEIFFNNKLYRIDEDRLMKKFKQLSSNDRNKLYKAPFMGVLTNGETLYASQNLTSTLLDKTRKISSAIDSPVSPLKKQLVKIVEKEEYINVNNIKPPEDFTSSMNNSQITTQQIPLIIKKKPVEDEASNIEEDWDLLHKSPINSLLITPHSEFKGLLNFKSTQQPIQKMPKKTRINIHQLIEAQSTQGLIITEKTFRYEEKQLLKPEGLIETQKISYFSKDLPSLQKVSEELLPPDSSLLPINNLSNNNISNISFNNLSNTQTPRSEARRLIEEPFNNNGTPQNLKTHDFFYTESQFMKDMFRNNVEFNLDSLFEALSLCHGSKTTNLNNNNYYNNGGIINNFINIDSKDLKGNNIEHKANHFKSNFNSDFCHMNSFDPKYDGARTKSNSSLSEPRTMESRSKEEQVLLEFSKNCGFFYEKAEPSENPTEYYMKLKGQKLVYNVYGINEFSSEKKSFSIVLKSPLKDSEVFLLCKGQEDFMRSRLLLEKHEEEMLEVVLKEMHNRGLKPIIYAKKSLHNTEAFTYINKIRNLKTSLINQTEELTTLALELEKDMNLLSVIGLKDELNEGIDELMKFAKDSDINVWMLTGDSKENAISTASAIGLFDAKYDKKKELCSEDQETLLLELRNHLTEIKNIYMLNFFEMMDGSRKSLEIQKKSLRKSFTKSIEDFFIRKFEIWHTSERENQAKFNELKNRLSKEYIVLNGKCLDIIYKDPYLKPHFIFLLSLFQKVIAYNLTPRHKYLLTDTVQNCFIDNPSVMAVGDGPNDSLMLQIAHIGVELLKNPPNSKKNKLNAGDLQISSLGVLKELMLIEGIRRLTLLENLVYFLFYKSFLIGWTLFLYNWFCSFTATSIYSSIMVFLYSFLFFSFTLILYVLFDKPVSEETLRLFPALYKEALLKKKNVILRVIVKSLIEGFAHSFIIFYLSTYGIRDVILRNDGIVADFTMMSFLMTTCIIFVPNFKILFICLSHHLKSIIYAFILTIFIYMAFIFVSSHNLFGNPDWGVAMENLLNLSGISLILFIIWVCQLISFIYERYILKKILYSPVKEKLADFNYLKKLTNLQILKDLQQSMDIGTLVKKIFAGAESLDPSIQEMFTPADINVNEIELNRYTLSIKDASLEKKFNFSNLRDIIKKTMLIYYLSLLLFLVYLIYSLVAYENKVFGFICLGIFFFLALLGIFFFNKQLQKNFFMYAKFLMMLIISMKIIMDWMSDGMNTGLGAAVVAHISTLNINLGFLFTFMINIVHFISYFISLICIYYQTYPFILANSDIYLAEELEKFYGIWSLIILISTITVLSLYSNYKFEKLRRSEYLAKTRMEQEASNIEDILAILVPKFVKDQLSQGSFSMQESQDDIAILFCDMCDFDHIINTENMKIVQILDEIFRNFDNLCIKHGVQKIETVGKTYMACAGLKACELNFSEDTLKTEKTRRLVSMAFEMMKFMEKVTIGRGETIKLKIGIHIGTVIAGVIGHHKPQFSLIGDTVNTTSRVCSTGLEGSITISDTAYKNIKNSNLEFQKRVVPAKGKGDITTYQVLKQRRKKTKKECKFKKRVMNHMAEIRKMYQQNIRESKGVLSINTINNNNKPMNKAINIMSNWYFQKKYETFEERPSQSFHYNIANQNKGVDEMEELDNSQILDHSLSDEQEILKPSNEILLTFNSENSKIVQQFKNNLQVNCKEESKVHLGCLFAVFLFQTLLLISVRSKIDDSILLLGIRATYNIAIIISLIAVSYLYNQKFIKTVILILYFYGIIVVLVQIGKTPLNEIRESGLLELTLIYLIHASSNFLSFIEVSILTFLTFLMWIVAYGIYGLITGQNMLFMLTMFVFNLLKVNFQMRYHIDSFNNLLNNESKKQEQNNLVSQLLPFHAFEKLKNISVTNKIELTDFFTEVTLLFADIAGFTKYSSSVKPEDVVNMLRSLFTEFDKRCLFHKVYKVYTIGDCYVVMGFLNANHRNPLEEAKNVVKMGLSMIDIIRDVRRSINFPSLDMRIGVHTGDIIGGIIGTDIVRYDIYGRDVLIANKMESNGVEGNIMVSEVTKRLLEKDENLQFKFEKVKDVECKVMPEPISGYLISRKEKAQTNPIFND